MEKDFMIETSAGELGLLHLYFCVHIILGTKVTSV